MVNRLTHQLNTVAVVTAVTVTVATITITIAFAVIIIIIVVRCSFIPLPTLLHRPGCFCSQSQVEGIKAVCVCADVWMWAAAAIVLCHLVWLHFRSVCLPLGWRWLLAWQCGSRVTTADGGVHRGGSGGGGGGGVDGDSYVILWWFSFISFVVSPTGMQASKASHFCSSFTFMFAFV